MMCEMFTRKNVMPRKASDWEQWTRILNSMCLTAPTLQLLFLPAMPDVLLPCCNDIASSDREMMGWVGESFPSAGSQDVVTLLPAFPGLKRCDTRADSSACVSCIENRVMMCTTS